MHRRAFLSIMGAGATGGRAAEIGRFRGSGGRTTVPVRMVDHRVMVPVRIGGETYEFLLASGAHTVVSRELARELELKVAGDYAVRGTGEAPVRIARTVVSGMSIGELEVARMELGVAPLEEMRRAIGFQRLDGVLGYEFFREFVVGIEASVEQLHLVRSGDFEYEGGGTTVELAGEVPEVEAEIDGVRGRFRVDTGDRAAVTWNAPFVAARELRKRFEPHSFGICGWGLGGPVRADWSRGERLRFGGFEVKPVWMRFPRTQNGAFADGRVAGSLGNALWSRFNVWIDVPGRRMILEPWTALDAADVYEGAGFWMSEGSEGFEVVEVAAGGAAERAGLEAGDVVTMVEGRAAAGLELTEVRHWTRRPAGLGMRVRKPNGAWRDVRVAARRGDWI